MMLSVMLLVLLLLRWVEMLYVGSLFLMLVSSWLDVSFNLSFQDLGGILTLSFNPPNF
jgi:hypothetical protein